MFLGGASYHTLLRCVRVVRRSGLRPAAAACCLSQLARSLPVPDTAACQHTARLTGGTSRGATGDATGDAVITVLERFGLEAGGRLQAQLTVQVRSHP